MNKLIKSGKDLKIALIDSHNQELFLKFETFLNNFKKELPDVEIVYLQKELPAYPAMNLMTSKIQTNLYYLAIPEGPEKRPFLQAIEMLTKGEVSEYRLEGITSQIEVKVFISPQCVFCPTVVELANKLAIANPNLQVFIIDGTLYPQLVKQYQITASPTVVINEDFILVGEETRNQLRDWIYKAAKKDYDASVLKSLLHQAQAEKVVELCLQSDKHLKSLLKILTDQKIFSRIGAMRVLEELNDKAPQKVSQILPELLKMLHTQSSRDKGDLLFLLGIIGNPEIIGEIEKIASQETGEIREIALEAIDNIKQRFQYC